jgi:hypothetical protein
MIITESGAMRKPIAGTFRIAAVAFPGDSILGDKHILVLETRR